MVWARSAERVRPEVSALQLRALIVVDRHPSINLAGLSDELGSIPSVTSRLCDRLQTAGLLVRRSSAIDRREIVLQLSPDGRRFVQRFRRARKADLAAVLQQMSARSRNALLMGLDAFYSAAVELGHADDELA
ncbi:MarR family transcriptional regulator [Saccharopolyspora elongata]|uniref:MarR family transcriptional regulator n=1 Tax=Saccharopolyspora elongata TaxID=2530387 RepID=UPI001A9D83A6|nr:MarR family transcriptional regulator [Saccharopolyspora elongata]